MRAEDVVLGARHRDTVSGWEGVATARYHYMNGCVRIELSASDKDGKPEGFVFDVQQVEPVGPPPADAPAAASTGGPRDSRPVAR